MTHAARFSVHSSPVGDVVIVTVDGSIVWLHPTHGTVETELENAARALRTAPTAEETDAARAAAAQLAEYFAGGRTRFDLALDWRGVRGFTRAALEAVCDIPYGETAGYGEVAIAAGSPRAARAVGTACASSPFSIVVPVHRVVRADGSLGEYGGRPEIKQFLIDLEGRAAGRP